MTGWLLFLLAIDVRIVYEYHGLELAIWSVILFPATMLATPFLVLVEDQSNILPSVLTVLTACFLLYLFAAGSKQQAEKNIEFMREIEKDTRIVPWHLLDNPTQKQIEEDQRRRRGHIGYERMRNDFKDLEHDLGYASALRVPGPGSREQKDKWRTEYEELMTKTLRPEMERLGIELPDDDDADIYLRLVQLSDLAKDGRLELAQRGMKDRQGHMPIG